MNHALKFAVEGKGIEFLLGGSEKGKLESFVSKMFRRLKGGDENDILA